jgi:hypothetical protein
MQQEDPKVSTEESARCGEGSQWKKRAKEEEVGRNRFDGHNPGCFPESCPAAIGTKSDEERRNPGGMSNNCNMSLISLNLALTP